MIFLPGLCIWEWQWREQLFCCSYWFAIQWGDSIFNFESWPQGKCCWNRKHKLGNLAVSIWTSCHHTLDQERCKMCLVPFSWLCESREYCFVTSKTSQAFTRQSSIHAQLISPVIEVQLNRINSNLIFCVFQTSTHKCPRV